MDTILQHRVNAKYPCCQGVARLVLTNWMPRQRVEKRCPRCSQLYRIEVTVLKDTLSDRKGGGMRIEQLDWYEEGMPRP
jgi:hypothetical protein